LNKLDLANGLIRQKSPDRTNRPASEWEARWMEPETARIAETARRLKTLYTRTIG